MASSDPQASWFAVRCIFHFAGISTFEERITLRDAATFESAIQLAEAEAHRYGSDTGSAYIGLAQAFRLFDDPGVGAEVFSLMRASTLTPSGYLDRFFDAGGERQQEVE